MRSRLSAIAAIAALIIWVQVPNANAAVILNTYPATGSLWKPIAIAVPFTSSSDATITSITAAVRGSTGTAQIGIMTDRANLPSGNFLFSRTVTPSLSSDLTLSGLGWRIPGGTQLWLAVIESPSLSFGDGYWQGNSSLNEPWAFKSTLDSPWFGYSSQTPAAIIKAQIPEPSAAFLVLSGLTVIGGALFWYRRPRNHAGTHHLVTVWGGGHR